MHAFTVYVNQLNIFSNHDNTTNFSLTSKKNVDVFMVIVFVSGLIICVVLQPTVAVGQAGLDEGETAGSQSSH